jgi:hypothetical protein
MITSICSLLTGHSLAIDFSSVTPSPSRDDAVSSPSFFETMAARHCPSGTEPEFFTVKSPHQLRREAATVKG